MPPSKTIYGLTDCLPKGAPLTIPSFAARPVVLPDRPRPDQQLFSTVFHVWGKLNRTFDSTPQADGLLDYFGQYVKWADPSEPNNLQVCVQTRAPPTGERTRLLSALNGWLVGWLSEKLAVGYGYLIRLEGYPT